ncbi:MAG: hypothetical protein JSV63_02035 [Candidatus Aenigmatarchaeota archaeon]|nr:MAG: hypothetical protein JSV63_02035 [Candidatus Aenigmarchaeota archaeon]
MEERVPRIFVAIGGLAFIITLSGSIWTAVLGILIGFHILEKYPDKKIHGIIPIVMNLFAFVLVLFYWLINTFYI